MKYKGIVMTLFKSLPKLYEYLITAMETMSMKAIMMDYAMTRLMHEMSMHQENVIMLPRRYNNAKATIHFGTKVILRIYFYCKNGATLLDFATTQRTRIKK